MKTGKKILLTIVILVAALALSFILDMSGIETGGTIGIAFGVAGVVTVWGLVKPKSNKENDKKGGEEI